MINSMIFYQSLKTQTLHGSDITTCSTAEFLRSPLQSMLTCLPHSTCQNSHLTCQFLNEECLYMYNVVFDCKNCRRCNVYVLVHCVLTPQIILGDKSHLSTLRVTGQTWIKQVWVQCCHIDDCVAFYRKKQLETFKKNVLRFALIFLYINKHCEKETSLNSNRTCTNRI